MKRLQKNEEGMVAEAMLIGAIFAVMLMLVIFIAVTFVNEVAATNDKEDKGSSIIKEEPTDKTTKDEEASKLW